MYDLGYVVRHTARTNTPDAAAVYSRAFVLQRQSVDRCADGLTSAFCVVLMSVEAYKPKLDQSSILFCAAAGNYHQSHKQLLCRRLASCMPVNTRSAAATKVYIEQQLLTKQCRCVTGKRNAERAV